MLELSTVIQVFLTVFQALQFQYFVQTALRGTATCRGQRVGTAADTRNGEDQ